MGEAWRKKRAAGFKQQACIHVERIIETTLFRAARRTTFSREFTARLARDVAAPEPGTVCLLRSADDGHELVFGNLVIAKLSPEAQAVVDTCLAEVPELGDMLPCRLSKTSPFGTVTLKIDAGDEGEN